jgi:uncharacterized protein YfaQ (DUF2300 family)
MTAQSIPALTSGDPSVWDQALYAFLVEKGNRSGSRRTVESYRTGSPNGAIAMSEGASKPRSNAVVDSGGA